MAKFPLDARLRAVVDEIEGEILADVGCDHGKVSVAALLEGRVGKAYAVDISQASLKKARRLAMEWGVPLTSVCCDGIPPVEPRADVIVIAGMGGRETVEILNAAPYAARRYILVPHQDAPYLREFLNGHYRILRDNVIEAGGKYYPVLVAIPDREGATHYPDHAFYVGLNLPESDVYDAYLQARRDYLNNIYARLPEGHALREELRLLEKL